ncbi:MAG: DUF697 domain-containing protein, partial [Planctomycetes bacterium]|nr:DUF697 domain-containing protein [Planctomycetota bacterium]
AQSGKTSIIRALTGNTRAEIGTGIRPCTRTAQQYPFPSEENCILRFLDTRGLGEVDYDPAEDLKQFQDQAHLLIVVMKALDHAQQSIVQAVRQIHDARPSWPILVVQTTLHEGYVARDAQHPVPYPWQTTPWPADVPTDLRRSLETQRLMFSQAGIAAQFVAIDFTLPEDGYDLPLYGLDELWQAIDDLLPLGLRNIFQQNDSVQSNLRDAHWRTARPHIWSYALAAGAAATIPVPLVDLPLVVAIQLKMFQSLASVYHQPFDRRTISDVLAALGIGYLGRLGTRELAKLVPGLGSAISAAYSGASTYALGHTLCVYFSRVREGLQPDKEEFRKIYASHFQDGRDRLRIYLDKLRSGNRSSP